MQGRVNLAGVLSVIGAVAILVGLSLDWFDPEISAWTAFEIVDLLLAAIAVGTLAVVVAGSAGRPWPEAAAGWLPAGAVAAFVLVAAALINHPPAGIDRSLEIGAWIAFAGAALLVVGAILITTEVSFVVTARPRRHEPGAPAGPPPEEPRETDEFDADEPGLGEPDVLDADEPELGEPDVFEEGDEEIVEPSDVITEPVEDPTETETRPLPPRDEP
jgi:NADH:ubiquinone oxidoreductase subunit 6 (subunit J)